MKLNIAVLPGDGIGPEIMEQGVAVLNAIAAKIRPRDRIQDSYLRS